MALLRPRGLSPRVPAAERPREVPPLYEGGARLLDWKNTARGGMTVDFGLRDAGPMGVHPFKGMSCGKEHGQRLRLVVKPIASEGDAADEIPAIYEGEALLMRWSDDSVSGMLARLLLDGGPDGTGGTHPFEGMTAGRKEGEAVEAAVWAVADDESTQHPSHVRRRTPFYELSETKQSQILCRDARFVSFLAERETFLVGSEVSPRPDADPTGFAGALIKTHLGIESRAVLGHDTAAAESARRRWRILLNDYFRTEMSRS